MVRLLSDDFEFWVVTRDRDASSAHRYDGVEPAHWTEVGEARVWYGPAGRPRPWEWHGLFASVRPDLVYVNGLFYSQSILVSAMRRLKVGFDVPMILAPRGELSQGALGLKLLKKTLFLKLAKAWKLWDGVVFQASTSEEAAEVTRILGAECRVVRAANISLSSGNGPSGTRSSKRPGQLRLLFLSRVSRKKNLDVAIRYAASATSISDGTTELVVVGEEQDRTYSKECRESAAAVPPRMKVRFVGAVPHEEIRNWIDAADFLILPTRGENYGHAVVEALRSGCPVIISDRTPWNDLHEAGAGWALPLESPEAWVETLKHCIAMNEEEHRRLSAAARSFMARKEIEMSAEGASRTMLREALAMWNGRAVAGRIAERSL